MLRTSSQCRLVARYQSRHGLSIAVILADAIDRRRENNLFIRLNYPEDYVGKVAMDIFHYKRHDYLVIIDYYSRWIEIKHVTSLTPDCVISRVKNVFTTHGIPDLVVSDNGRQFDSDDFRKFAKSWCLAQHTIHPYSLQENGMAERTVQAAKRLLNLAEPEIFLLNYHASHHSAMGVAPAVALMGRQLATRLPFVREQLSPCQHRDGNIRNSDQRAKTTYKRCYDRRHRVRPRYKMANQCC